MPVDDLLRRTWSKIYTKTDMQSSAQSRRNVSAYTTYVYIDVYSAKYVGALMCMLEYATHVRTN